MPFPPPVNPAGSAAPRFAVQLRATWMAVFLVILVLSGARTTTPAVAEVAVDGPAVDRFVTEYLARHGLPGAAVAVVEDGKPIHTAGYGGPAAGFTERSPMAIGSVSKMFTAFAVLQLVDAGRIGLDDPVRQHLAEFVVGDPRGTMITVRQLLSHTSGLPNPTIVPPATTVEQDVARVGELSLATEPGAKYAYSNLNYRVAARLIEVVADQPFEQYLDQHVFDPLGMHDTRTVIVTEAGVPGLADGHVTAYGSAVPLREMIRINAGSGGVISTANDLALWLAMQQHGGVAADGTRVLSARLIEEARTRQPGAGISGLGWQHSRTADPLRIGHSGSLTRYSARADLVPESGIAVAVILNSYTPTREHPYELSSGIIDLTEGRVPTVGAPVPTIIDGILGLITLGVIMMAVRGLLRSRRWADRRNSWSGWRYGLRLLPQLIMPVAAVIVVGVLPVIDDNAATVLDVFGLWPAAIVLLLVSALAGATLITARLVQRRRTAR